METTKGRKKRKKLRKPWKDDTKEVSLFREEMGLPKFTKMSNKKLYDLTVLLKSENDSSVEALVQKAGADSFAKKELAKLELAYPVRKEKTAFMGVYTFLLAPDALKGVQEGLKFDENCLRYLLIVGKEGKTAPSTRVPRTDFKNGAPARKRTEPEPLTNEALQKKIEEISE